MFEHGYFGVRPLAGARWVLAAIILVLSLTVSSQAGAAVADTGSVYSDPSGDSKSAPDITQVTLTPGSDGTVGFDIPLSSGDLGGGALAIVEFDTDRNRQTGNTLGAEVVVVARAEGVGMGRSDSTNIDHHSLDPQLSGGHLQFKVTLFDLGVTSFDFIVLTSRGADFDAAPEGGAFTYPQGTASPAPALVSSAPQIRAVLLPFGALIPKAGSQLKIPMLQVRLTDDMIVTPETVTCSLSFRGKALALSAPCTWKIPRGYRKKTLTLVVHATYHGSSSDLTLAIVPR